MEKKKHKLIVEQILAICEKNYRKGFQQGFHASNRIALQTSEVNLWRLIGEGENYRKVICPITNRRFDPLDVILAEITGMQNMKELEQFLTAIG